MSAAFLARLLSAADVTFPEAGADAFGDDNGSTHEVAINQLASIGVVTGVGDDRFAPNAALSRELMAALLVRAYERVGDALPVGVDAFADDGGSVHEPDIDKAAAAGFTRGVHSTLFDTGEEVTRGQMASFLPDTQGTSSGSLGDPVDRQPHCTRAIDAGHTVGYSQGSRDRRDGCHAEGQRLSPRRALSPGL